MFVDQGQRASRKASLIRQLQERRLQANMRGREIKSTDNRLRSKKFASRRRRRRLMFSYARARMRKGWRPGTAQSIQTKISMLG
jgi:hypothetical protein